MESILLIYINKDTTEIHCSEEILIMTYRTAVYLIVPGQFNSQEYALRQRKH